jgi:hypothetical protein
MNATAVAEAATLPTGVVRTFGRNGSPFGCGMAAMDASAVAEAATLPTWASLGRSLGTLARSATGRLRWARER